MLSLKRNYSLDWCPIPCLTFTLWVSFLSSTLFSWFILNTGIYFLCLLLYPTLHLTKMKNYNQHYTTKLVVTEANSYKNGCNNLPLHSHPWSSVTSGAASHEKLNTRSSFLLSCTLNIAVRWRFLSHSKVNCWSYCVIQVSAACVPCHIRAKPRTAKMNFIAEY